MLNHPKGDAEEAVELRARRKEAQELVKPFSLVYI